MKIEHKDRLGRVIQIGDPIFVGSYLSVVTGMTENFIQVNSSLTKITPESTMLVKNEISADPLVKSAFDNLYQKHANKVQSGRTKFNKIQQGIAPRGHIIFMVHVDGTYFDPTSNKDLLFIHIDVPADSKTNRFVQNTAFTLKDKLFPNLVNSGSQYAHGYAPAIIKRERLVELKSKVMRPRDPIMGKYTYRDVHTTQNTPVGFALSTSFRFTGLSNGIISQKMFDNHFKNIFTHQVSNDIFTRTVSRNDLQNFVETYNIVI